LKEVRQRTPHRLIIIDNEYHPIGFAHDALSPPVGKVN
jgi:hypothetical protein